jgi:hemoglobin
MEVATLYERVGGMTAFERLVDAFYDGVEGDAVLRPLYPESLTRSRRHLALFLAQYFGGPATYSERRGHPRLRMRHLPFKIGQRERDAWIGHMRTALDATIADDTTRSELAAYFEDAATFLINTP